MPVNGGSGDDFFRAEMLYYIYFVKSTKLSLVTFCIGSFVAAVSSIMLGFYFVFNLSSTVNTLGLAVFYYMGLYIWLGAPSSKSSI